MDKNFYHDWLMKTLKGMVGRRSDGVVREYANGHLDKGNLTLEDISEIDTLIEAQYVVTEEEYDPELLPDTIPIEDIETAEEVIE